eukprot:6782322-Prymnesium_polylepis.1
MLTYPVCPPPMAVGGAVGEQRTVKWSAAGLHFADAVDLSVSAAPPSPSLQAAFACVGGVRLAREGKTAERRSPRQILPATRTHAAAPPRVATPTHAAAPGRVAGVCRGVLGRGLPRGLRPHGGARRRAPSADEAHPRYRQHALRGAGLRAALERSCL